jgi:agmatine/peptidylarginine deiminase
MQKEIHTKANRVYFSHLLPKECPILWSELKSHLDSREIEYAFLNYSKNIRCRDCMPIQTADDTMVHYWYYPDYLEKKCSQRTQSQVVYSNMYIAFPNVNHKPLNLILDGGNIMLCGDVIVMTDKVITQNINYSRGQIIQMISDVFECDILFLPCNKSNKFGHVDDMIQYLDNNKILLTSDSNMSSTYYQEIKKTLERKFEVIPLKYNVKKKHKRDWSYINFLQVGNTVFIPCLNIPEDRQAISQIQQVLPDNVEVVGIPALEIVRKGGGLRSISWSVDATKMGPKPYRIESDAFVHSLIIEMGLDYKLFEPYFRWLDNNDEIPSLDKVVRLSDYLEETMGLWDKNGDLVPAPSTKFLSSFTKEEIKNRALWDLRYQLHEVVYQQLYEAFDYFIPLHFISSKVYNKKK